MTMQLSSVISPGGRSNWQLWKACSKLPGLNVCLCAKWSFMTHIYWQSLELLNTLTTLLLWCWNVRRKQHELHDFIQFILQNNKNFNIFLNVYHIFSPRSDSLLWGNAVYRLKPFISGQRCLWKMFVSICEDCSLLV